MTGASVGRERHHAVAHMTWDEVADRIAGGAAGILPIGAASKQHGLHLPLDTDLLQAEWLADRIAEAFDSLIWPTVHYGHYPAFAAYAGSVSLTEATFEALVAEIAEQILGFGCVILVVLDTGLSTRAPIDRALARLPKDRVLHLRVHEGPHYREATAIARQGHGSHADELETSLMLALAPDVVDMRRAQASPARDREIEGPLDPADPASPNYSPSGSYGDPALATRGKGDRLLGAMTRDAIESVARFVIGRRPGEPA